MLDRLAAWLRQPKTQTRLLACLFLLAVLALNRHQWAADVTDSADDSSYLSYALTLGLDGDLDFANEPAALSGISAHYGRPPHFYGPGLLAAPFVALFSLADRWQGHAVIADHLAFVNSWSYFGFSFAVNVCFLAGLLLFARAARRILPGLSPLTPVLFCLGAGVVYYVLIRPRMAHGFEFFGLSLVVWAACQEAKPHLLRFLLSAAGVFIVIASRPNNLNAALLPLLLSLLLAAAEAQGQAGFWRRRAWPDGLAGLAGLGCVLAANLFVFGTLFPSMNKLYGQIKVAVPMPAGLGDLPRFLSDWLALLPKFGHIFLGSEFGLLYTNPLLALAPLLLAALCWRHRANRLALPLFLLGAAYLGFSLSIALLWRVPGDSYGWRYLLQLFAFSFTLYLVWLRGASSGARRWVQALAVVMSLNGLAGALLFTKAPALSYRSGVNSFGIEANHVDGFNLNLPLEIAKGKALDTLVKDGPVGYVRKNLLKRSEGPRENPPVVGLWLLMLAGLWAGTFLLIKRAYRPTA